MNPIYKFTLAANGGDEQQAFPVWRDDVTKDFELQTNQEFYRAKLSGKLTFIMDDYDFIVSQSFDTQFDIKIYISYDAGTTWALYWSGQFWKTNCSFDGDHKKVTLTPEVNDQYNAVLAGMEKEYNLIDLAPEIMPVNLDKRPMIQVYIPGQTVISCFLSGMYWEQECDAVNESDVVEISGHNYPALEYKYHFSKNKARRVVDVKQTGSPVLPDSFFGAPPSGSTDPQIYDEYTYDSNGYRFHYIDTSVGGGGGGTRLQQWTITRISDNTVLWIRQYINQYALRTLPYEITLLPASGSGASGEVTLYVHDIAVYSRYMCDVDAVGSLNTYPLPDDDLVENNRNYSRAIGYYFPETIYFSELLSTTPTPFGLYKPGYYYQQPAGGWYYGEFYPVSRNAWGRTSVWFCFFALDWISEQQFRKPYKLRHAYPLASVISVLLAQVAPGITHQETTDYSQFFYGANPLLGINQRIFITPKSNLTSLGYDQPAQKAPITLKRVLDMLRDCFRCYWFIDDQNRFRIEHIKYFMNGGAYSGTPVIGRDLTTEKVTRNEKKWSFDTSQFEFDKPEMAARYQFGWMDDVTKLFEGNPIDIISKYVNPDNIEEISVSQFTSDVDYILLNPGEISKDGFALLAGVQVTNAVINPGTIYMYDGAADVSMAINSAVLPPQNVTYRIKVISKTTDNVSFDVKAYSGETLISSGTIGSQYLPGAGGTAEFVTGWPQTLDRMVISYAGGTGTIQMQITVVPVESYKLPYVTFHLGTVDYILQNAYVAFVYLQQYYAYDMPARRYKVNGYEQYAQGIKKLKTQKLKFPALTDPNTLQLIKTNLGNGTIQKMSVNLSSRNANTTLKYDTE